MNKRITEFAVRIASGNPELAYDLVRIATEFPTEKALKDYLHEHPGADKSKHTVEKGEPKSESKSEDKSEKHPQFTDKSSPYYINRDNKHLKGLGDPEDWDERTVYALRAKLNKKLEKLDSKSPAAKELNEASRAITNWKGLLRR
jgi:hypothetical protein